MTNYECGCRINWTVGPPPRRCPAHWLQERIIFGDKKLERDLAKLRPTLRPGSSLVYPEGAR